ncbi:hypothetical protein AB5N19_10985 [Seiridium cardinale]|uniref:Intradiol ring-cleavage dioxygenases domain-containing protein n=1 Tax=Seiridium cardinale TaxID=138064 RepID=A0ABR2X8Y4_9PEZI
MGNLEGVYMMLDLQLIDVQTSEPVKNHGTVGNDNDEEGIVQIETLSPGHYAPRATHTHLLVHQGATVVPNNTLAGGNVSHVGQVFFDQDLIYEVDTLYPYTLSPNLVKLNSQDMVLADEAELPTRL